MKWWLLVIPQALIVAAFTTGTVLVTRTWMSGNNFPADPDNYGYWGTETAWRVTEVGFSLLGLLVFVAAVGLLFTGRYHQPLFDLVMGLNRWQYRVLTYTALLRDEYPPFRLDQGPEDPQSAGRLPAPPPPARSSS